MYQFFGAKSAIRFDAGAILVANTGTGELRYFDAEGHFVWRAGGRGGGPGGLRRPEWLQRPMKPTREAYRMGDER